MLAAQYNFCLVGFQLGFSVNALLDSLSSDLFKPFNTFIKGLALQRCVMHTGPSAVAAMPPGHPSTLAIFVVGIQTPEFWRVATLVDIFRRHLRSAIPHWLEKRASGRSSRQ